MPVFISRIAGRCGLLVIACITVCTNAIFVCGLLSDWRGTMKSLTNQQMHFEVLALSLYAHIPGEIPACVEAKNEKSSYHSHGKWSYLSQFRRHNPGKTHDAPTRSNSIVTYEDKKSGRASRRERGG